MKVSKGTLEGILLIEPEIFEDSRGFFLESYSRQRFSDCGIELEFVQDNHSKSSKGTLRGLHYQVNPGQDKLVRVIAGEVFDVAVDVRRNSSTFGKWEGFCLSAENRRSLFIPKGFAHGFCVLSDTAEFVYKCSEYYSPDDERGIIWNDPDIGIEWPIQHPILSDKDARHLSLAELSIE